MASRDHYVYLYLELGSGKAMYVGYGMSTGRAMSHAEASHNAALREWLEHGQFDLRVAGPYASEPEGLKVEAALISAIKPKFNVHPGTGPKFRPLGVPSSLSDRLSMAPMSVAELGVQTGGALVVYIAQGNVMKDGRPKFDPADPDPQVVAIDVEAWWAIDRHLSDWRAQPVLSPQVLVGAYGPPQHRFVIGAYEIDTARWGDHPDENRDGKKWRVPLVDRSNQDAAGLCGRRITGLKFGRAQWEHYQVIANTGHVVWPLVAER